MLNTKELLNELFGKESQSMANVEVYAICKKLRELGVEVIELFPDKIEFDWSYHVCSYKNSTFYCGTKGMLTIENISELNKNALDCLVGKLNYEQLNRVGNLIDLYEDKYTHNLSLQEDMKYIGMFGTKLYREHEQAIADYALLLRELKNVFQSGFLDRSVFGSLFGEHINYILTGE